MYFQEISKIVCGLRKEKRLFALIISFTITLETLTVSLSNSLQTTRTNPKRCQIHYRLNFKLHRNNTRNPILFTTIHISLGSSSFQEKTDPQFI